MAKRAVVVGINDYSIQFPGGTSNLNDCVNDAASFYHLLVDAFGFDPSQTYYYTDQAASRTTILQALRYAVSTAEPGDVACFYFSGQGARVRADASRADGDRYYEAIVPASGDWITDWEMYDAASTMAQSAVNFTVILDSAHSGGLHQPGSHEKCVDFDPALVQAMVQYMRTIIPCGTCQPPDSQDMSGNVSNVRATGPRVACDVDDSKALAASARSTLITACRYDELAYEGEPAYQNGLLTQSFLDMVTSANFQIDHATLLGQVRTGVAAKIASTHPGEAQTPQLLGLQNRPSEGFLQGWTST